MAEKKYQKLKQRVKLRTIVFFTVGLFFETIAFFVGYADNIPFIFKLISPDYFKAKEGLRTLEEKTELNKRDRGFDEISQVILKELTLQNLHTKLVGVSVIKISRGRPVIAFSAKKAGPRTPIIVELSDGQKPEWNLEFLANRVSELKSKNVFEFAIAIFFLGVLIQIINFFVDKKDSI